jgi:hypothetical protein
LRRVCVSLIPDIVAQPLHAEMLDMRQSVPENGPWQTVKGSKGHALKDIRSQTRGI